MKKSILALMVVASSVVGLSAANAADGQVHFTGSITADACTINNGVAGPLQVALGTVSEKSMAGVGTKSTPTAFTISLTDCPETLTKAAIKFDGASDPADSTLLKLDAGSTATGVGIEIGQTDGSALPLYTASAPVTITDGNADIKLVGRYKATAATSKAGTANGTSDFTINYN